MTISRRTSREISAICRIAIVTVGSTIEAAESKPDGANQSRFTAKTMSSTKPIQKSGIDWPAMVTMLAPGSGAVLLRRAIQTPSGIATTAVTTIAATASVMVYGSRSSTTVSAGRLKKNDVPTSPCTRC